MSLKKKIPERLFYTISPLLYLRHDYRGSGGKGGRHLGLSNGVGVVVCALMKQDFVHSIHLSTFSSCRRWGGGKDFTGNATAL